MRIGILGASNCVNSMGFSAAMPTNSNVSYFENFSIGGSTSLLALKSIDKAVNTGFDFIFLDFVINETKSILKKATTFREIRNINRNIISRLIERNILPIITIFPSSKSEFRQMTKLDSMYIEIAKEFNIPYLNIIEIIDYVERLYGISRNFLFRDGDHISRWLGKAISLSVIDALAKFEPNFTKEYGQYPAFSAVEIKKLLSHSWDVFNIKNNLIDEDFITINNGDIVKLSPPENSRLIGYSADFRHSSSYLEISGENTIYVDLGTVMRSDLRFKNIVYILPLQNGVRPRDNSISLRSLCNLPTMATPTCYSQWGSCSPNRDPLEGLSTIGKLFFDLEYKSPRSVATSISMAINLWEIMNKDNIKQHFDLNASDI